ncbi:hypothetical protein SAMN05421738_101286 [Algoriella xinjiangensis]|uniref:Uncharacterized protein n=1 Tax=Algoriella xinjiangensis TaxID=684065 RepID=A0A1I4SNF3_9FLAO|nr:MULTISPECIES: hypothetical protein [Algoriella]MBO6211352.1 hypothetical protein [Algoriella sp.]SFM65945.1 hypothetical protein SAMN05421738_101286 [Algoriella xinjiangensis]VDH16210.1 Uncharacterised protein [Algoriella xinjiangensis]
MEKLNFKHPIFFYLISFILVSVSGFLKIMKVELADSLLDVTFALSVFTLVIVLINYVKKNAKKKVEYKVNDLDF